MATNEELEKRIENLEKEVQHLKAVLQYQMRNKKKWFILNCLSITFGRKVFFLGGFGYLMSKLNIINCLLLVTFWKK